MDGVDRTTWGNTIRGHDDRPALARHAYRTHTCGALRADDAGTVAKLAGWVHRRRDYGKLIFIDLRDRHGITQVVIDAADAPEAHATASRLRSEFVVAFEGEVALRQPGTENAKLATGAIELQARSVADPQRGEDAAVLHQRPRRADRRERSASATATSTSGASRCSAGCVLRSRLVQAIREVHHDNGFVEVETPNLIKSTPEGARDFIVPSRLQPGTVYALPAEPAAAQAAADGRGRRPLFPDRPLLPRRGHARRPAARVHPARPRDELRRRGDGPGVHRADGHRGRRRRRRPTARSARSRSRCSSTRTRWSATARTSRTSGSRWSCSTWRPRSPAPTARRRPGSACSTRRSPPAAASRGSPRPGSAA